MEDVIIYVSPKRIVTNPLNPRKAVGATNELTQSIIEHGIIQPLVVRTKDDKYELIAGERRLYAVNAGIKSKDIPKTFEVPVIVREMDDRACLEVMLIENLQRENLTDFEQAESFKQYIENREDVGEDATAILSEKTGKTCQYIRRRSTAMTLHKRILKYWKDGIFTYGHMEQFLRISKEDALAHLDDMEKCEQTWTVSWLKNVINSHSRDLSKAVFDKKAAGCAQCTNSTKTQVGLFGDDFQDNKKVLCLNKKCYHANVVKYLEVSFKGSKIQEENKTTGFVMHDSLNYDEWNAMYSSVPGKCTTCDSFKTIFDADGVVYHDRACIKNKACYSKMNRTTSTGVGVLNRDETRTINIANTFSEAFLQGALDAKIKEVAADDLRAQRVALMALIRGNNEAVWKLLGVVKDDYSGRIAEPQKLFTSVLDMDLDAVKMWISKISTAVVMNPVQVDLMTRKNIAKQFDIVLDRDFVITEPYLEKKKKDELISLNEYFGKILDTDPLLLAKMKKDEIVNLFMHKDLSGLVPPEIIELASREPVVIEDEERYEEE